MGPKTPSPPVSAESRTTKGSPARAELAARLNNVGLQKSPTGSASTSGQEPRKTACLDNLPVELKAAIVRMVLAMDTMENPDEDTDEDDEEGHRFPALFALSKVDRGFYQLCRPLLFQELSLEFSNLFQLQSILADVIPRQGIYVRQIFWRICLSEVAESNEAAELPDPESRLTFDELERGEVIVKILEGCPKISEIDCDLCPPGGTWFSYGEPFDPPRSPATTPTDCVARLLPKLTNLTFIALTAPEDGPRFPEDFLVSLLKDMRSLEAVTLTRVDSSSDLGYASTPNAVPSSPLGQFLASLEKLHRLDLTDALCADDTWARLRFKGEIKLLALDDTQRFSLAGVHAFCTLFANSLTTITFDYVPYFNGAAPTDREVSRMKSPDFRFKLPNLTGMAISGSHPPAFLRAFATCPRLCNVQVGDLVLVTGADMEAIIGEKVWKGLERLTVNAESEWTDGEKESLELFAHSRGVEVMCFEDSDSEDEDEMDGFYPDGFDGEQIIIHNGNIIM